ncbi:hypothetical protein MRB53_015609 [Persea americana]|uniref:Uncharacterized protein n=1 Tax=Persea americana TaxID=3435 RepID=A0ACC2LZS5_PERAE|nr:hypothetical protein MRB53_015609 [Persea americana]|eukprot:TRINITY_DN11117_c2_g3_i1.p1 TRINITY_DN11117_c2_g3~~TRINITY_DN11117_c2_g3_i1.p1  ORF type:complete len:435 (+),score=91.63 TRINITY_DN11117_c2_g3_i1:112-1416(+)
MEEFKPKPTLLLIWLPLLLSSTLHPISSLSPSPSPASQPSLPSPSSSPSPSSTLDPKQLTALQSINFPTGRDPCLQPSPHNATLCDSSKPFRHLISLRLSNCSADLLLSSTALNSLSTLQSLSFLNCPIPPFRLPSDLSSNLRSFSCVSSLRHLTGVWLSHLYNLTELTVSDVPISTSGPSIILSNMNKVTTFTISGANLTGFLPRKWHPKLTHIDFSHNKLKGRVPISVTQLANLKFLNLSSNQLLGQIPDTFGDLISLQNLSLSSNLMSGPIPDSMASIPSLAHLDLSSNQFNGSVPNFLSEMKDLKYLNLENNNFQGVIPFNGSTIKRFAVFKVGGNSNLCYNHSTVSSMLKLGVAPCDKDGFPVQPPPDKSSSSGSSEDANSDSGDDSSEEKPKENHRHGPNKVVLGVAIGLSSIVFLIIFLVLLAKWCG